MKLLVTGSTGFLGRFVVAEALRRGHRVRAVVRRGATCLGAHENLELATADLRSRNDLATVVEGVDAVLHLAAAKTGDLYAQLAGTVLATENLLWAMTEAGVSHIVSVSSFAVYDYVRARSFTSLTENSELELKPYDRDAYAQTKLIQERLVREHAVKHGWRWTILRPGVIFGKENLWTARLGSQAGRWWIRIGAWAQLPLTYVENCAEAIIKAAEERAANGNIFNIVDDDLPSQSTYAAFLRKHVSPRPHVLLVPWLLMRAAARSADFTNRFFVKGSAKLPGVLVPARLHARMKPLRYHNKHLKAVIGWRPRYDWRQAVLRSICDDKPHARQKHINDPTVPEAALPSSQFVAS